MLSLFFRLNKSINSVEILFIRNFAKIVKDIPEKEASAIAFLKIRLKGD